MTDLFPFNNPYLESDNDLQRQLLEAILRRGFLMRPDGSNLRFDTNTHPDDPEYLQSLLASIPTTSRDITTISILTENGDPLFDVPAEQATIDAACKSLADDVQTIRIRGFYWYDPENHNAPNNSLYTWDAFKTLEFGTMMPVAALDPGVALLVKVLAWHGVGTIDSCEGHGWRRSGDDKKDTPHISFLGEHHGQWGRFLLGEGLPNPALRPKHEFIDDRHMPRWKLVDKQTRLEPAEHKLALDVLFRMAICLMNPKHAKSMREAKAAFKHEIDLSHPDLLFTRMGCYLEEVEWDEI